MTTSFGLIVTWDGKRSARIEIPLEYWNATCGLCGVFDGNPDNDFQAPDGELVRVTLLYHVENQIIFSISSSLNISH